MSSYETALAADPEVARLIGEELNRQQTTLQLIASENFTSPAVLAASGSVLTNKYSEGYPGRRYYGGNQVIDEVEDLARNRATALFGAEHANVQPHAGANANLAAYQALLEPGATILAMRLDHGGHLTHGSPASIVSKFWRFVSYGVTPQSADEANPGEVIDFDQVAHLAKTEKPALIVAGSTAYARVIDPRALPRDRGLGRRPLHVRRRPPGRPHRRRRPPEPGRAWPTSSPSPRTRRCAARGAAPSCAGRTWPRRSTARSSPASRAARSSTSSPPRRWPSPRRRGRSSAATPRPVVANAAALAAALAGHGFRLVSGGTDNHMLLVDLQPFDAELTGKEAQEVLDRAGITCNRNTIPDDPRSPFLTSGLRLGTAAETTAGMGPGRDAAGGRPHRAHAQGPDRRGGDRRGARGGRHAVRRLPAVPRSPGLSACPTSAGTAWSW